MGRAKTTGELCDAPIYCGRIEFHIDPHDILEPKINRVKPALHRDRVREAVNGDDGVAGDRGQLRFHTTNLDRGSLRCAGTPFEHQAGIGKLVVDIS